MYKGGYLFGNRVVVNKTLTNSKGKYARGSSSFITDGVAINRPEKEKNLAELYALQENITEQIENYKKELQTKDFSLCEEFDKRARGLNDGPDYFERMEISKQLWKCLHKCETQKISVQTLIDKKIRNSAKAKRLQEKRKEKGAEGYKLNKAKVRDKCTAFFELERSRKFCAFYSVSFPEGSKEEDIYKVWNCWLTNLRKTYGLRDYLWVAEYQKNGTLHYHMLCNVYMNIKRVNRAMGVALFHNDMLNTTIDKYNGVDVKKVTNNRGGLNAYLTKYVSKSEEHTYKRAPWRCSQSVSALFTSVQIDEETSENLAREFARVPLKKYENDYAEIYFFNVKSGGKWYNIPDRFRTTIQELNNVIANEFERVWLEYHIALLDEEIQTAKREKPKRKKQLILHKLLTKYNQLKQ